MTELVPDPFGTARLRESVVASWRSSPTRFREDANAEEDLVLGGYRDRLLVELAQNASDAAKGDGVLRVELHDRELRVANTGEPLTQQGVEALASLRASAKQDGVGRFGVGFSAVLTVTDAPRIVSTSGAVCFDAQRTRAELGPEPAGRVPVLRLLWTSDETPPDGFATEVRLPLRDDVDAAGLLRDFADQAIDLLLSLDGLARIEIAGQVWAREAGSGWTDSWHVIHGPSGTTRWLIVRDSGDLPDDPALGAEARTQWTVAWALPGDERNHPLPLTEDVLHAPTPTDERLSLPARLIATFPVEPSRRRVRPGPATEHVIAAAAKLYPQLVRHLSQPESLAVVPLPRFPLSEVDDHLRQQVIAALRAERWLKPQFDHHARTLTPAEARLLPVPSNELAESVVPHIESLAAAELAAPEYAAALSALDVVRLGLSDVVDMMTGIGRPPTQWRNMYAALAKIVDNDPSQREELGALPVPLVDGRTVPGPRGTLIADGDLTGMSGVRVVHPDAVHPLLERLGAHRAGPGELLASLTAQVENSITDAESGLDTDGLVNTVLRLVSEAGTRAGEEPWLGALALRATDGEWRRADELALPGSQFLSVLADDSPLGVLAQDTADQWPAHVLAAVGVLDSFTVVVDEAPTGPDHDLADEADWWDEQPEPPTRLEAIRDLDLVADDAWPAAIRMLAAEPETWRALRSSYTTWWLAQHATLAGEAPTHWRLATAHDLTGLYDVAPTDLAPEHQELLGVRTELTIDSPSDAADLLDRLGDPEREVSRGTAHRAYVALAEAVRDGVIDPSDVDPPELVRTLDGEVTDNAVVLDAPWLAPLTDDYVAADGLAEPLAELLDIPLASENTPGSPTTSGEQVNWADLGAVVDACDVADLDLPDGGPVVHDELEINGRQVAWWVADGIVHCTDTTEGLARALAWTTGRWEDRHLLAALLEDPTHYVA